MEDMNQPPGPLPPSEPTHLPGPEPPTYVVPALPAPASHYYVPTQDERTFATLSHALQMVGWWIAPLIILLTKKESRFVKFHATQVLLLQAVHLCISITAIVIFMAAMFGSIASAAAKSGAPVKEPPVAMFVFMPFMWLVMFGMWVVILVLTIMFSIKAGKGEWAEYPVLGRLAKYMLNM